MSNTNKEYIPLNIDLNELLNEEETIKNYIIDSQIITNIENDQVDFIDCYFKNTKFINSSLQRCYFQNCIFENCDLSSSNFYKSNFKNTEFLNSKLIGCNFELSYIQKSIFNNSV